MGEEAAKYAAETQMRRYPKLAACQEIRVRHEIEYDFERGMQLGEQRGREALATELRAWLRVDYPLRLRVSRDAASFVADQVEAKLAALAPEREK